MEDEDSGSLSEDFEEASRSWTRNSSEEDEDSDSLSDHFEEASRTRTRSRSPAVELKSTPESSIKKPTHRAAACSQKSKLFCCKYCKVSFTVKSNCTRHENQCSISNGSTREVFSCSSCGATYSRKDNLSSHLKKCKNKSKNLACESKSRTPCLIQGCKFEFYHKTTLLEHLQTKHADDISVKPKVTKSFASVEDFNSWKEKEEESTFSYFGAKKGQAASKSKHFYCQHDGSSKLHSQRKGGPPNAKGRVKVGHYCISKMKSWVDEKNCVHVEYYPTHNHRLSKDDFQHHPLPAAMDRYIKKKISEGLPPDFIYEKAREKFIPKNSVDVSTIKGNILTKKRILDRARRRRMARRLHQDDAKAVFMKVSQMLGNDSSILLYKPYGSSVVHGPPETDKLPNAKDLFMLGIQTERQFELMKKHAGKIFIVDETHGTNQYKYQLLTCMVVDENRRGWPVAHLITSKSDAATLKFFFQTIQERAGGNTNITCVITDDDAALINAMTDGFQSQLRHLLCKWHVLKNLKDNLRSKVSKDLFDTMHCEVRLILNCNDESQFHHLCECFVNKYQDNKKASKFVLYFNQYYLSRPEKWAMCFRNFPHAEVNTTGHIESFHSRLKKFYLKRKVNKRLDDLLDILLQLEWDDHCTRSKEASTGFSSLPHHIYQRHQRGMLMDDSCVVDQVLENTWEVKSATTNSKESYVVVRYSLSCSFDHCYSKCSKPECHRLCAHLYSCSCPDHHPLCKHIHKLHSYLTRDEVCVAVEDSDFYILPHHKTPEELNIENLQPYESAENNSDHERKYQTTLSRLQSHLGLLEKFQAVAAKKQVPEHTLIHVEAVIADLVEGLGDLEVNNNNDEQLESVPHMNPSEKFAPNEKLKTQVSQLAPFKRPGKRKQEQTPAEIAAKKKTVLEDLLKCASNARSVDVDDIENEMDIDVNDSFTLPSSYVEDPSDIVLELENHKISLLHLKSLELNLSKEEEKIYANRDPLFRSGVLYSLIIDSFIFKLSQQYEGVCSLFSENALCASQNLSNLETLKNIDELGSKKVILMPANLFTDNWLLVAVMVEEGVIRYFDPHHHPIKGPNERLLASMVCDLRSIFPSIPKWIVKLIQLPKHSESEHSGPYICHFAKQTVECAPYSILSSQAEFRKYIYSMIVGSCLKRSNYFEENCGVCGLPYLSDPVSNSWRSCSICHQWFHESCVNAPSFNSFGFFICP